MVTICINIEIGGQTAQFTTAIIDGSTVIQAEDADIIDETHIEKVAYLPSSFGVSLISAAVEHVVIPDTEPDLVFHVKDGTFRRNTTVTADKNTTFFNQLPSGKQYSLKPITLETKLFAK